MKRLDKKVAIVTGGATGIGEAISKKFAKEGAQVFIVGMPQDPVAEVQREIIASGGHCESFVGDISLEKDAREASLKCKEAYGRLDVLVNNAGVFPEFAPAEDYPIDVFDNLLKNNLRTMFLMTKFCLPDLKESKGNIVNLGSVSGLLGQPNITPYGGTKGFIHAMTRGLANEQAANGIRVNAVCPGPVDTAWTRKEHGPMTTKDEVMLKISNPMGRRGTPEEMANAACFLASDEASYITALLMYVDGGFHAAYGPVGLQTDGSLREKPEGELDTQHAYEGATEMR